MEEAAPAGERGRPRSPDVDRLVLDTVMQRLVQQGYARLSVSAIAEELGVGKPTIYLRWHSKAALAAAALATMSGKIVFQPHLSGDSRRDLVRYLSYIRKQFAVTGVGLTGALWSEEDTNPELMAAYRQYFVHPTRFVFRTILEDGVRRGELRSDAKLDSVVHMLVGSLYAAFIAAEHDDIDIEAIVDLVLSGIRTEPTPSP